MLLLGREPLSATQDFTLSENHTARPTNLGDLMNFTTGSLSFVGGAVGGAVVDDGWDSVTQGWTRKASSSSAERLCLRHCLHLWRNVYENCLGAYCLR